MRIVRDPDEHIYNLPVLLDSKVNAQVTQLYIYTACAQRKSASLCAHAAGFGWKPIF